MADCALPSAPNGGLESLSTRRWIGSEEEWEKMAILGNACLEVQARHLLGRSSCCNVIAIIQHPTILYKATREAVHGAC